MRTRNSLIKDLPCQDKGKTPMTMLGLFCKVDDFCIFLCDLWQCRRQKAVDKLTQGLHRMVFADRGYVAKWLADLMVGKNIHFAAKPRKNMDKSKLTAFEKIMLIETCYFHGVTAWRYSDQKLSIFNDYGYIIIDA